MYTKWFDNSIDEALAGFCNSIDVQMNADGSITVVDDGRGIPVDMHPTEGKPTVEVVLTVLHAGGKFEKGSYQVSGGLHGVGVSCVNALSAFLEVEVRRDGQVYHQRFERGDTVSELKTIGKSDSTGTKITFMPDDEIFSTLTYNWDTLANRLRELAFLNRGITVTLAREADDRHETFHYEGGIREFVTHLNANKSPLYDEVIYFEKERDGIIAENRVPARRQLQRAPVFVCEQHQPRSRVARTSADFVPRLPARSTPMPKPTS